jgi:RNA polymerase sigma-70 factor (ECF subfamily)
LIEPRYWVSVVSTANDQLVDIVRRITAGDSTAEDEIIRRYERGIAVIIDNVVRNQSATEDLSQETFRIVIEKLRRGDLRQPESLSGFVCSVAKNAAIEYIRRTRRSNLREETGDAEHICDPAPNQLEEMLARERAEIVRQVIGELKSERDRDVLFRYYVSEEDKNQICSDLGITRNQFNKVIYRALARFKELYVRKIGDPDRLGCDKTKAGDT